MRIPHRHHDRTVSEYLLKHQNIPPTHHKVTRKGVA